MELRTGQDIRDGFQLLVGLAEIHVPRMWVERHPDRPDHQVGVCGQWVVGCGWRDTRIGLTIRWVCVVSGWLGVGGETPG